ncbi:hypothetical protein Taro_044450 [Colocasia esculenta]|uniref:Protein kinase domain-containing protein n=1 Tax=Colocasia esculenta TaxID=4460 RepID=A0A843WLZ8_COLES|nr:hypothetical protein [Colocasia esculenta]
MAPETVARGEHEPPSDVWSLGYIEREMLGMRRPPPPASLDDLELERSVAASKVNKMACRLAFSRRLWTRLSGEDEEPAAAAATPLVVSRLQDPDSALAFFGWVRDRAGGSLQPASYAALLKLFAGSGS